MTDARPEWVRVGKPAHPMAPFAEGDVLRVVSWEVEWPEVDVGRHLPWTLILTPWTLAPAPATTEGRDV